MNRDLKEHCYLGNIETDKIIYFTDDDELERKTDWILKKKKQSGTSKKRKAESSPEAEQLNSKGQSIPDQKVVPFKINNPNDSKSTKPTTPNLVERKTCPTNKYYGCNQLPRNPKAQMKSVTAKDYKVTALNNNVWKINALDSDTYKTLSMKLNAEKYQWFSYENKQDRPIKVMGTGLYHTCSTKEIMEDLQNKGLKF